MLPRRPRVRITLPRLSGSEALLVVAVLDGLVRVIWRAYGDDMANAIGRDHPAPETLEQDRVQRIAVDRYAANSRPDDDDIAF